jgi:type I restriction enzyme M protein
LAVHPLQEHELGEDDVISGQQVMITGTMRSKIDKLWEEFWTGGITNPLTVIEQISFLMFSRLLDVRESLEERKAARLGRIHAGNFGPDEQHLRWSSFKHKKGDEMLPLVRDQVFRHFRAMAKGNSALQESMADSQLLIPKPSLLVSAVTMIDQLPLTESDTKGDLYEYLLSKLTTAGINGQFRTPRHINRLMVELVDPKPTEVIGDPACGTAGFLVAVMEYLLRQYTSPEGLLEKDGEKVYTGDKLEPFRDHIQGGMLHGFDFDVTMLRIAAMNLMLHGVDAPAIHYQDTLSTSFPDRYPLQAAGAFDVILANPPFKGSLDIQDVHPSLTGMVKTRKTELLFLAPMLRILKPAGRCATIVPDGVLFGSSKAHVALRRALIEENQLEGILSLPSGVFKPYAGVSTAIVVFTKGGKTENVWFYDVEADGYSLDDKRTPQPDRTDLPDVLERWRKRDAKRDTDRTAKAFFVPAAEIRGKVYDLSINKYKETVHKEVEYDPPKAILARLRKLEKEIAEGLDDLEAMLG